MPHDMNWTTYIDIAQLLIYPRSVRFQLKFIENLKRLINVCQVPNRLICAPN